MVTVEIWADVACPWCYIGKADWHTALARFPRSDQVRTKWRSFELRPGASAGQGKKLGDIMVDEWGLSSSKVDSVFSRIRARGEAAGLRLHPEVIRPTSTFDAQRLLHLAQDVGAVDNLMDELFATYHRYGTDLSNAAILHEVAVRSGMDSERVRTLLSGREYADRVHSDARRAREVGVTAVPFFRFGNHEAVVGTSGVGQLLSLLNRCWEQRTRTART